LTSNFISRLWPVGLILIWRGAVSADLSARGTG
jgi:hypothetical protein